MPDLNRRQFLGHGAALGALLATGATLLGACSDDKPAAPPASVNGGRTSIQLASVKNAQFAGSYLADANGYYTKLGFEKVELLTGGPDIAVEPVVAAGTALFGYTSTQSLAVAIAAGAKLKVIAALLQRNPFSILSVEAKPIATPAALIGKRVGIQPVNQPMWTALLDINKIDVNGIKTLPVQNDPTPLVRGDVDGWFAFALNEPITVKERGGKPVVMSLQDYGITLYDQLIITTEDTLTNRRAEVKALLHAELMGWQKNRTDLAAGAKLAVDTYGKELGLVLAHETDVNTTQIELQKSDTTTKKGIGYMSADDVDKNLAALGQMKLPSITKATYTNELLDEIYSGGLDLLK